MKVAHVIPAFHPAYVYGGPIAAVHQLCQSLGEAGCEVRVLTTNANGLRSVLSVESRRATALSSSVSVRYCRRVMRHSVSPELLRLLPSYIGWADVVHLTAAYSFPTIPTLLSCRVLGKPVVWSPRGGLQRWSGSTRLRLKGMWERVCNGVAPRRILLHTTSEKEARESRDRFPEIETVVIPNGVEIPERVTPLAGSGVLRLGYLGRLHPIKGIENLLLGCKLLNDGRGAVWSLAVAGTGEARYREALAKKISELALAGQVRMVGELVGRAKTEFFEHTDLTVVPSHTESFGIVVAESLAHGVPVLASRGTPWQGLEERGCGLWVDNRPADLADAIVRMSRMPLREMGQRGREWMVMEFSWTVRASEMLAYYRGIACDERISEER